MRKEDMMSFRTSAEVINNWLDTAESVGNKITLLEFAAEVIKNEWVAFSHGRILSEHSENSTETLTVCFPLKCLDENGNEVNFRTAKTAQIDFAKTPVAVSIWSDKKFISALVDVKTSGFIFSKRFRIDYVPEIDTAMVTLGNHHAAAAVYCKTGKATASVVSFHALYPHVKNDGLHWRSVHTDERIGTVTDWRFALLYSVKRLIWLIASGNSSSKLDCADTGAWRDEYVSERSITLEQLAAAVKNYRISNRLTICGFAKIARITRREAYRLEHSASRATALKLMKFLGIEDWELTP